MIYCMFRLDQRIVLCIREWVRRKRLPMVCRPETFLGVFLPLVNSKEPIQADGKIVVMCGRPIELRQKVGMR